MCLSNNSYETARVDFNDTILLGLEVTNPAGAVEHIVGYYNTVSARASAAAAASADFGWPVSDSLAASRSMSMQADDDFGWHVPAPVMKIGNAMLIAVPAQPGTVDANSLIPVGKFPNFMTDYKKAVAPRERQSRGMSFGMGTKGLGDALPIVVKGFDGGTYDVVIAPNATSISSVISKVDSAKRPQPNGDLYAQLDRLYPHFTFVLFCFSEEDKAKSGCAVVKYKPRVGLEHLLYLPGVDGHNGKVETGEVELNHTLVVGSYLMDAHSGARPVTFSEPGLRETHPFFLDRVVGLIVPKGTMAPQGDFLFKLEEVRQGIFRAKRQLPPGWNSVFGNKGVSERPFFLRGELDF